jgi:leucyl aminopeptidase
MKIFPDVSRHAAKPADLLAIACFADEKDFVSRSGLPDDSRKTITKALSSKKFSAKTGEHFFIPTPHLKEAGSLFLIGLGPKDKSSLENVRRASAKIISQAKSFQYKTICLDLDSFGEKFHAEETAVAIVEGARLSGYVFDKYKTKPNNSPTVEIFRLYSKNKSKLPALKRAVADAEIVSESVLFTRDVANEPANVLTPARFAQIAKQMASKNNLTCRVLAKNQIQKLGMGGVLGVSQGSANPPQFVILENKTRGSSKPLVLVGKGVTFDTGGISIKPSGDMDKMKFDMCGAAAVMGAMKAIANLRIPVKVIGLMPLVENMPGSTAQRPGDIIRCLNGKTVEVLNTDAEGRLILADALSYAERYHPRAIVDIATLTGACAATFGDQASGVMGTDPDLINQLKAIGQRTGERLWELPLWDEYFDLIRATYADIQNISKKHAGTITAGLFLKEFAGHTRSWAHLDVAGTAWADAPKPLSPIGATGVGVRLFVEWVKSCR